MKKHNAGYGIRDPVSGIVFEDPIFNKEVPISKVFGSTPKGQNKIARGNAPGENG